MDHRFSTLFFQAPPLISSKEATMSGALPDPKTLGKSKSTTMKHLLRKLFGIPRQKTDPLIKTAEPVPSELSQQVWSELATISKTPSKTSKPSLILNKTTTKSSKILRSIAPTSTIVVLPPNPSVQISRRKDIFHKSTSSTSSMSSSMMNKKRSSTYSTRDSKFSSISSLPSLAALSLHPHSQSRTSSPGPSLLLSVEELALLQSLIRKVARQLKKQEYLTNHLAGNLVHLFARKEVQIHGMKRVRAPAKEMAAREVWRMREGVGRGFLRRGVLVGRSEGALNLLRTALDNATRAPSTPRSNTRRSFSSYHPSISRTSSPSSYTTAMSDTNSQSSIPTPQSTPTFSLSLNTLHDTTSTLLSDLSIHSILNSELKTQIYTACLASRWNGLPGGGMNGNVKGNINDKITMHRFVSFVESRVKLIEECDKKLIMLVGKIEGLGKGSGESRD